MPQMMVRTDQKMAPSRAAITIGTVTMSTGMILPTVLATSRPQNAPAKFATEASTKAAQTGRARVATTVAMEFAESCRPL